jgi:hypothetical protein
MMEATIIGKGMGSRPQPRKQISTFVLSPEALERKDEDLAPLLVKWHNVRGKWSSYTSRLSAIRHFGWEVIATYAPEKELLGYYGVEFAVWSAARSMPNQNSSRIWKAARSFATAVFTL